MHEEEINKKYMLYNRILISYIDFQQSFAISSLIIDEKLHDNYPRENRIKLEALNSAMIIAYCRPFSRNKGAPDLPGKFIHHLSKEELEIHNALRSDRNTVIAHSDGEAWKMRPYYETINGSKILIPLHHGVHRPFLKGYTEQICALSEKQRETCFEEREILEKDLVPYIPVVNRQFNHISNS